MSTYPDEAVMEGDAEDAWGNAGVVVVGGDHGVVDEGFDVVVAALALVVPVLQPRGCHQAHQAQRHRHRETEHGSHSDIAHPGAHRTTTLARRHHPQTSQSRTRTTRWKLDQSTAQFDQLPDVKFNDVQSIEVRSSAPLQSPSSCNLYSIAKTYVDGINSAAIDGLPMDISTRNSDVDDPAN